MLEFISCLTKGPFIILFVYSLFFHYKNLIKAIAHILLPIISPNYLILKSLYNKLFFSPQLYSTTSLSSLSYWQFREWEFHVLVSFTRTNFYPFTNYQKITSDFIITSDNWKCKFLFKSQRYCLIWNVVIVRQIDVIVVFYQIVDIDICAWMQVLRFRSRRNDNVVICVSSLSIILIVIIAFPL